MGAGSGRPPAGGTVLPATIVDTMQDGADHLLYVQPDASRTEDAVEVRLSDLAYQQNSLAGHERCWLVLPDDAIHAMPRHAAQAS